MLMIRTVVPDEQLTAALTQEQVRNHGSELVGPPLGGALFAASRALPFVFCAAMTLVSFLCALFVKLPPKQPVTAAGHDGAGRDGAAPVEETGGVLAGLKIVFRDPVMRATALTLTLTNMVGYPLYLCLIVLLERQGSSSGTVGFVIGAMAVGGLAGTLYVRPLHRLFQPGRLLIVACAWLTVCIGGVVVLHSAAGVAILMFLSGLPIPAAAVMINILILQQVPDEQRGRANAALQTVFACGMPLGILIAGMALQYFSAQMTLVGLASGMAAATLYAASQGALRAAKWPATGTARDAAPAAS
jgi:predicted MFS family arabinose efflux permease